MNGLSFLDQSRSKAENNRIGELIKEVIVKSSMQVGLIKDTELAMVPEAMVHILAIAGVLRDDLFSYHEKNQLLLQFPIIRNQFGYAFAKGAESAYLWNQGSNGFFELKYNHEDGIKGRAGVGVERGFLREIVRGMKITQDVFVDFQEVMIDPQNGFVDHRAQVADVIALAYYWVFLVGLDYGMDKLGIN